MANGGHDRQITDVTGWRESTVRSALNLVLMAVMVFSLFESRWQAVYGVAVLLAALAVQLVRHRRRSSPRRCRSPPQWTGAAHTAARLSTSVSM